MAWHPYKLKRKWDEWNLRVTVLVSLFFQIVLIFRAPSRKRTGGRIVTLTIWAAYLLADWIAAFAVGLISNGQGNGCDVHPLNKDLAAFWAPFLLLHLGGPDTITAFSLEDNELWIRHLLGLLIQLAAVAYVFSQSIPNKLWIPTVLMIFAGLVKYVERTRALYMACLGNFKASMLPPPDAGPNYAQLMEEYSSNKEAQVPVRIVITKEPEKGSRNTDEEKNLQTEKIEEIDVVKEGYNFFNTFKRAALDPGLIFDAGYEDYLGFLCTVPGIDAHEIKNYTNSPCNYTLGNPSNFNTPSVTISHLAKTRTVTRTVTNVALEEETYVITARMAPAVAIETNPPAMTLRPGGSRKFTVTLTVRSVTGAYSFGEVLMKGSRGHKVRIPVVAMGYDW